MGGAGGDLSERAYERDPAPRPRRHLSCPGGRESCRCSAFRVARCCASFGQRRYCDRRRRRGGRRRCEWWSRRCRRRRRSRRRRHGQGPDRGGGEEAIGHGPPVCSRIGRFPDASGDGAEIEGVGIMPCAGYGNDPATRNGPMQRHLSSPSRSCSFNSDIDAAQSPHRSRIHSFSPRGRLASWWASRRRYSRRRSGAQFIPNRSPRRTVRRSCIGHQDQRVIEVHFRQPFAKRIPPSWTTVIQSRRSIRPKRSILTGS